MAIPESFLEEVNARTDIVDLISAYVPLQKKGNRYWGCCPFHSEKTPSFSVSPERDMYYCFGCHKGGSAISFIMEQESVGFVDAVTILAQRAGLQMPETRDNPGEQKKRERLYELNKEAARFFHANLNAPEGEPGRRYLMERGLSKKTITNFGLGYSPNRWDGLIKAMQARGYSKLEMIDAGLVVTNQKGSIYDRFRGRVMFPIIDLRGNVIGFGGRVLDDSKPKYLNSPDTIIYNKSRNLFAMNIAKKSKSDRIILTEGYMDTISLHQGGFDYAIASLGTSLTEDHARLLSKYCKEVILSYDGDSAGIAAAQRAIGILGKVGLSVKVLRVTGAKDPDEFIKKYGSPAFQKLLDGSENQMEYQLLQVRQKHDVSTDEGRISYLKDAAALIARLSSPVEREIYAGRVAEGVKLDRSTMIAEVNRQRKQATYRERRKEERRAMLPAANQQPEERRFRYDNVRSALAEEGVIRLLLSDGTLYAYTGNLTPEMFSSPLLQKIFSILLERWKAGKETSFSVMSAALDPDELSHLTRFMQQPESLSNSRQALADYINTIQGEYAKRQSTGDDALLALARRKNMEEQL